MSLLNLGAVDISSFCTQMKDIVQIVGYILMVVKIAIPLLIIALGIFDFAKAVVAEKEDEIKKQTKRLLMRVVAGVIIFLIPNIILWIFELINDYSSEKDAAGFAVCEQCFLHPSDC